MYRIITNVADRYFKLEFYTEEYLNANRDLPEFQNAEEFQSLTEGLQNFIGNRNYNRYELSTDDPTFIIEFV